MQHRRAFVKLATNCAAIPKPCSTKPIITVLSFLYIIEIFDITLIQKYQEINMVLRFQWQKRSGTNQTERERNRNTAEARRQLWWHQFIHHETPHRGS